MDQLIHTPSREDPVTKASSSGRKHLRGDDFLFPR
jgi:hypothetical protein